MPAMTRRMLFDRIHELEKKLTLALNQRDNFIKQVGELETERDQRDEALQVLNARLDECEAKEREDDEARKDAERLAAALNALYTAWKQDAFERTGMFNESPHKSTWDQAREALRQHEEAQK